ncbi:hypothetical protein ACKFKG_19765 [Phormidesmis sp. 146-35]
MNPTLGRDEGRSPLEVIMNWGMQRDSFYGFSKVALCPNRLPTIVFIAKPRSFISASAPPIMMESIDLNCHE